MSIYDNIAFGIKLYERLGKADIMVGIPSFKNAATIGYFLGEGRDQFNPLKHLDPLRQDLSYYERSLTLD